MRQAKRRLNELVKRCENLRKEAKAELRRTGSIPIDNLMKRCLNNIQAINHIKPVDQRTKDDALYKAFKIYGYFQNLKAPERQDYDEDREVPLERIKAATDVGLAGPSAYSGWLGYQTVNWDSSYLMAVHSSRKKTNPFWNPTSGKRDKRGRVVPLTDYWAFKKE